MKITILMLALVAPSPGFAQQTRELDAHVHGHSTLNIAFEGTQIVMELEAPGADIVGFEHAAQTPQDRAKLDDAIATLSQPLSLFVLPAEAGCTVVSSTAGLNDEHGEGESEHEAHDHAEKEGGEHTEFHAEYLIDCADPAAINRIDFAFFDAFPNAQEVDVQMISDKGAQGFEVGRDAPVLDLAGLI